MSNPMIDAARIRRSKQTSKLDKILSSATTAGRSLTADEEREFEAISARIHKLDAEIADAEAHEQPDVNLPADQWQLASRLTAIEQSIAALQNQPIFIVTDKNYNQRVRLGLLLNGDIGLAVTDANGNTEEFLPAIENYVNSALTTSSATPVSIAGSPTVTAVIGASGDCEITAGAFVGLPAGGAITTAFLVVDGGATHSIFGLNGSAAMAANVQSTRRWKAWILSGLTPGSHVFTLQYDTTAGPVSYSANFLSVRPF